MGYPGVAERSDVERSEISKSVLCGGGYGELRAFARQQSLGGLQINAYSHRTSSGGTGVVDEANRISRGTRCRGLGSRGRKRLVSMCTEGMRNCVPSARSREGDDKCLPGYGGSTVLRPGRCSMLEPHSEARRIEVGQRRDRM